MALFSYLSLLKKAQKELIPLHCLFELTYQCNLRCLHCYIIKRKEKEIKKETVFYILRQLKDNGCLYLTFSGGEIFLRRDFFSIAHYACRLNFALRLFTNGTLITAEIADKIKELYPLAVEISLYGFKDTHEKITRIKGSFLRTVNAIKLLVKRKIKVLVKTVLMRQNVTEIWKLKDFVEDLGAQMRQIGGGLLISPCDNGNKRPLNYRLTDGQLKKYLKEEFKQRKSLNQNYKPKKIKENESLCNSGLTTCNISPYAELNPCVQIRLKHNSLKKRSFQEIWSWHPVIKRIRALRLKDRKVCLGCLANSYCFACLGIAYLEKGSFLACVPEFYRQARLRKEIYEESYL